MYGIIDWFCLAPSQDGVINHEKVYWSVSKIGKIVGEETRSVGHSHEGVIVAGEIHSHANRIFLFSINNWG